MVVTLESAKVAEMPNFPAYLCLEVRRSPRPTERSVVQVYTRILDKKLVITVRQIFDQAINSFLE